MAQLSPKWTCTSSSTNPSPGQGGRWTVPALCATVFKLWGDTVLTPSTQPQENYNAIFCVIEERERVRSAFQLQEIPPPNCSTCQATVIASTNKRNLLFCVIVLGCIYFSSVLSSPFSRLRRKKTAPWNCTKFPKQVFFSPVKMAPSSLRRDNSFVLKKLTWVQAILFSVSSHSRTCSA